MKILQVRIPEPYMRGLDILVKAGRYPSRSVAVRIAIRELLRKELRELPGVKEELEAPSPYRINYRKVWGASRWTA